MKRLLIVLVLGIGFFGVIAQTNVRTSAYNYLRHEKLDKAMEAIDKAILHEKTMNDAKTWFYRGNIYFEIARTKDEKFKNLVDNPMEIAYESYLKALKFDEKDEYKEQILTFMGAIASSFYNNAASSYNANNFKQAMNFFEKSYDIYKVLGKTDTATLLNAAISAEQASMYDEALSYYNRLIEMGYEKPSIFISASNIYKVRSDTAEALKTIMQAREKYPDNYNLIIEEVNFYLASGDNAKALQTLELAIKKDSTNPTIFYAIGFNYDQTGNFEEARKAYKKSIDLDSNYFDANYNLGALYVNKAAEVMEKANELPLDETEKYNELKAEANGYLEKALPYIEKAYSLNPEDQVTVQTLKRIYTRLDMLEKLKAFNESLKNK